MKFYGFGDKDKPVILLLPGTCCHWKPHDPKAPYDGYDESDDTREKARTVRLEKALPVKC